MEPATLFGPPVVVVNPHASRVADSGRREPVIQGIRDAVIQTAGMEPRVIVSDSVEEADAALDQAAAERARAVVVVGGDGTARDAATRLANTGIPLGIVPAGTANLFAATIGIPLGIDDAVAALSRGQPTDFDLGRARWGGRAGERIFVVAAGMGFDAHLMEATTRKHKQRFGRYGYFLAGAPMLVRLHGFDCVVELGEERLEGRAIQVLAANGGEIIPGLLRPRRRINPRDGLLDVILVLGHGLPDGVLGGLEAIARRDLGRSRSGRSLRARVSRVRIVAAADVPVEVDGDVVGSGWLEAEIIPRGIRVVVPGR